MKKILVYLKSYILEVIMAPLFKLLEASFELLIPLVVASIIDVGIAGNDKGHIGLCVVIMAALGVIGLTCALVAQYFSAKAAVGYSCKLRRVVFDHIQSFSFSQIDEIGTSTLITRMTSDISQIQTGVNLVLRLLLRSPFVVFGAMIMAFTVDVKAAIIFVLIIPILFVVVFAIMFVTIPLYKKVQKQLDGVLGKTRENLSGTRVIRAFNKQEDEITEFNEKAEILFKFQNRVGAISNFMNPVTFMLINGATIILIYVGAVRVDAGILKTGQVVALVNYMAQILVELIKLANLIVTVNKALACGNRVAECLDISAEKNCEGTTKCEDDSKKAEDTGLSKETFTETNKKSEYIVEFNDVSLTYRNAGEKALENINFKVKRGETVGIIGGTGSGKTSLVNLIPAFYNATEGNVMVDGRNVSEYEGEELSDKIAIVMQKAVLFKGTIRDNIRWGKNDATDEDIYEALTSAVAKEIVDNKENGLDEIIEQGGKNLSGGQRQRLTIARALVKKPEILILDDSASALDYATDAALRKNLKNLSGEPAVFIVSQRTSSIQHADTIVVLDDGQMVGVGTHEELLENCEVYREIYESQYRKAGE